MWLRALLIWLLLIAAETAHGIVRTLYLVPVVGDLPSRQIGVATGSILILVIVWVTLPWLGAVGRRQWFGVGALWVVLMIAFEVALGRWVIGYSWSRIGADFNLADGGLLPLGLLVVLLAPWLAARLRRLENRR